MAGKKDFLLRVDPALWQELQAWAADELRSVNGQIEYVLRQAVRARRQKTLPETAANEAPGETREELKQE
jgi:hypothetical protein